MYIIIPLVSSFNKESKSILDVAGHSIGSTKFLPICIASNGLFLSPFSFVHLVSGFEDVVMGIQITND